MWPLVLTVSLAPACGADVQVEPHGGTTTGGASGNAGADVATGTTGGSAGTRDSGADARGGAAAATGGSASALDASSGSSAHDAAGSSGGAAGTGPVVDSGMRDALDGASGEAGPECVHDADCPPPDRNCAVSQCSAGRCEAVNAPSGATVADVPADCHASICDGAGNATGVVVAQWNAPSPGSACLVGTCSSLGQAGTAPLAAGAACHDGSAGALCDGAGNCVECNHTTDCAPGLYCDVSHHCGSAPCTDLDCGGACPPCDVGKRCIVEEDCLSYACDVATGKCIADQCLDHQQDGNETAVDCGGGICKGCELGQACLLDMDCKSQACDAVTSKCGPNQCADHRTDGSETGVDCGGPTCSACPVGQKCKSNLDCQSGEVCSAQKVCE